MDTRDDDIQASWWRTCDFIASAAETLLFLACLAAAFFALFGIGAVIMMVLE